MTRALDNLLRAADAAGWCDVGHDVLRDAALRMLYGGETPCVTAVSADGARFVECVARFNIVSRERKRELFAVIAHAPGGGAFKRVQELLQYQTRAFADEYKRKTPRDGGVESG